LKLGFGVVEAGDDLVGAVLEGANRVVHLAKELEGEDFGLR
jgi:hypothetical protein